MTWQKLLIIASMGGYAVACNRQPAPCTQTVNNQTTPPPASSPSSVVPYSEPQSSGPSYKPKSGFVPDEQTAVAIAVAVFVPIYGKEQIDSEKPFHARLKDGVWFVDASTAEPRVGGTAMAEIAQNDGRVLRVVHYK